MKNLRKLFVVASLSVLVLSLNAQTDAGKILLGGSSSMTFGAYTNKYKSDDGDGTAGKGIAFSFTPQAGFFVIDGLAVGLQLDMSMYSNKPDGANDRYSSAIFMFAPFARYYYGTAPIKPFAEFAVAAGFEKEKVPTYDGTETTTTNVLGFQFKLGGAYFLNDHVSVDAGLGYQSTSYKDKDHNENDYKDVFGTFGFEFGVTVVL